MKRVNIISLPGPYSIGRSLGIIASVLRQGGMRVSINGLQGPSLARRVASKTSRAFRRQPCYDVNLFYHYVDARWFSHARVNCLIPNQECFQDEWLGYLGQLDWILCKTKYAQEVFTKWHCRTEFISFTSHDRLEPAGLDRYDKMLHLCGHSPRKGTQNLVKVWQRHPEWPRLTVLQHPSRDRPVTAANVECTAEYVDYELLRKIQNAHGVHLCPSESEGFGHYIVEAMSCKAVTVTTDAPPMNEVVTPERGVLVREGRTGFEGLGTNYYVDNCDLERKVEQVLSMTLSEKQALGEAAREWYLENDRFFRNKIVEVVRDL